MTLGRRVHVIVSGRVQGVCFRAATQDTARDLGLTGWVRNLVDGRVEAVAEGDEPALQSFVRWCGEGPPAARVDNVESQWADCKGEFRRFDVVG